MDRTKNIKIGAVVMAAGSSSRFGSNKLLADFCGRPLIEAALHIASSPLFSGRVAVTRTPEIQKICQGRNFPCLLYSHPLQNDTVRLGLNALAGAGLNGCLFLQGDQPLLTEKSIEALIHAFAQNQRLIYRLSYHGIPGSPVLFPDGLFPELCSLPSGCGGSYVMQRRPELVRLVEAKSPNELLDADTPKALRHIAALYGARHKDGPAHPQDS